MTITHEKTKDSNKIFVKDEVNNLGIDFMFSNKDFNLQKVLDFISDFVNMNYVSLHEKRHNGLKVIDTNENIK